MATSFNHILIPGIPLAFATHERYCEFLDACGEVFGVHPRNMLVRESTKMGFSLSPDAEAIWVAMRTTSDLDLAIVDPDYFHFLDREISRVLAQATGAW